MTVQELIGKVKLDGDARYISGLRSMERAAQAWSSRSAGGVSRVLDMFGRLNGVMGAATGIMAGLVGAGGLIGFGAAAIKASADWEQLTVTLTALTGSAATAQEKLQFIKELAIPATATTEALSRAGVELQSFQLRLERALPLGAKLQAAFAFDPQALEKAVSIMGRLAQGDFPDIELLSGLGLNKQQFREQGIQFDPQGKLLSSARDTLDALERIVEQKYGGILAAVANTTNAKLATVQDRWQTALRSVGNVLQKELLPVLERFSGWLDALGKSNQIQEWLRQVAFGFRHLGEIIAWAFGVTLVLAALAAVSLDAYALALKLALAGVAAIVGGALLQSKIDSILKEMDAVSKRGPAAPPLPTDKHPELGWGQLTDPLATIERNTRQTAQNTAPDIKRFALGGGPLGQIGVAPVELAGIRRFDRQGVVVRVDGSKNLETWVAEIVQAGILAAARQGVLNP